VTTASPPNADERIAHLGPLRRWLISPEIGALIGTVVVWLFLWGNGETFGTAGTTLNWLDVAAPYGIMATAIALLMIGGEFDLSSGVMTGAAAMSIGLLARFFTGTGMHIGWAILAAFAGAAAIGWFNGFMVNKTGLPSFIITLASFFVMRGLMLVLSKRLANTVYVDQIKDQRGAAGFSNWIAHEWILREFRGRDTIFVISVIAGAVLFVIGLLEQSFVRRTDVFAPGLLIAFVGTAVAIVGFVTLLNTDGASTNLGLGVATGGGAIVGIVGLAAGLWSTGPRTGSSGSVERSGRAKAALGVLGVALALAIHLPFDRNERHAVLSWISPGIRPLVVVAAALAGLALTLKSLLPAWREKRSFTSSIRIVLFGVYGGFVLMSLTVAALQLSTVQALRAMGMLVLGTGGIALLLAARAEVAQTSRRAQLGLTTLAALALIALALVIRGDASATRFRTVLPTGLALGASVLVANGVLEYIMQKRTFADHAADRRGRVAQIVGGLLIVFGAAIRLLYSNAGLARAAKLREAGEPVPQNVLRETVLWWLLVAAVGAFVLVKTHWGNWIFATGGNKEAARAIGIPVNRVKIALFMVVSLCGALSGTLIALRYGTVQADQGTGLEFEFIIAAVVGGCLMTGGYGSVIGASLGAAILAMSTTGFQTVAGWNGDGRYAFLGGVLLVAVLVNTYTRRRAQEAR
jgi:ribose/xylose/arabinose/galactoside ABC-type transport system permease subunit